MILQLKPNIPFFFTYKGKSQQCVHKVIAYPSPASLSFSLLKLMKEKTSAYRKLEFINDHMTYYCDLTLKHVLRPGPCISRYYGQENVLERAHSSKPCGSCRSCCWCRKSINNFTEDSFLFSLPAVICATLVIISASCTDRLQCVPAPKQRALGTVHEPRCPGVHYWSCLYLQTDGETEGLDS